MRQLQKNIEICKKHLTKIVVFNIINKRAEQHTNE